MAVNYDILIRILVSVVLGAALGLEREFKKCPAGLRTHTLVCIGSAVFIVGLTTAATLWIAAGIGLMAAINEFFIASMVTIISIAVLSGGFWLEKQILHKKKSKLKP
jgi:putative Mg2+ transporter-C (MgtC) family protein